MENTPPRLSGVRSVPWRLILALAAAASPTVILAWLLASPGANAPWIIPVEHLIVTANVSIIALFVAVLTARAALHVRHYPTLLIAIGFMTMAGIFAVHGLSTPGVIQRGAKADDAGLVSGISAQLALWCSAVFFAIRYTPLVAWLERRVAPRRLLVAVLGLIGVYAVVAIGWPSAFGGAARALLVSAGASSYYDPSTYGYAWSRAVGAPRTSRPRMAADRRRRRYRRRGTRRIRRCSGRSRSSRPR